MARDVACAGPVPDALDGERVGGRLTLDEDEFRAFYAATAPALRRYVCRVSGTTALADDILQDAYLRLLQARIPERDSTNLRAYLFRIATNLLNDHFRKSDRAGSPFDADAMSVSPAFSDAAHVQQGLQRLRPRERQLLWLAYGDGSTHREIAAATGLRLSSIRTLLFRARRRLLTVLGDPARGRR